MPNRSRSYRPANVAIISIAQQARPKVSGQRLEVCAQWNRVSAWSSASPPPGKRTTSSAMSSSQREPAGLEGCPRTGSVPSAIKGSARPRQVPLPPGVHPPDEEDRDEDDHPPEGGSTGPAQGLHPGEEKRGLGVEEDEHEGDEVE